MTSWSHNPGFFSFSIVITEVTSPTIGNDEIRLRAIALMPWYPFQGMCATRLSDYKKKSKIKLKITIDKITLTLYTAFTVAGCIKATYLWVQNLFFTSCSPNTICCYPGLLLCHPWNPLISIGSGPISATQWYCKKIIWGFWFKQQNPPLHF